MKASIIPAAKAAGFAWYTGLHCLRHFYASWCVDLGSRPKVIQERMGHASITITYGHPDGHLFPRGDDTAELTEAEESIMALGGRT